MSFASVVLRRDAARPHWLLALAFMATLLAGCGGGGGSSSASSGGGGTPTACSETARKQWVLDVTREWYLFPETLPASVDLNAYPTAEDLLDALTATAREQGKDRYFSYLTTRDAENSLLGEGQFIGFGFRNRTDPGNRPFILDVFASSPAADAGLRRGDEIVAVDEGNGFIPVSQSLANGGSLTDVLGPADAGVTRGLRILRAGTTLDVSLTKRTVTIDPVPDDFGVEVLPLAGTTGVGYLHLRSYTATADAQVRAAFEQFRAQNLQYYIIDLRYNGGGFVDVAETIDNLLGGARSALDTQFQFVYNAAKSSQDSTVRFQPLAQSVSPVRIAFLTTDATASASEININAMKPWAEVAIVGSNTFGKPVGQLAFDLGGCQDRLRLIAFKTVNAAGEGDYYNGLAPVMRFACAATDTLDAPLGNANDGLTKAALGWLQTGSCSATITGVTGAASMKPQGAGLAPYASPRATVPLERWVPGAH